MLLSARMLNDVSGVNSFSYAQDGAEFTQGDTLTLYFQLFDMSKDKNGFTQKMGGRRFVPEDGATLEVVILNLDDDVSATKVATQPFDGDASIWSVDIDANDTITGTCAMTLALTEGAVVTRGRLEVACRIQSVDGE